MSTATKCNLERMLSITGASAELAELTGETKDSLYDMYSILKMVRDISAERGQVEAFWQYVATIMNALAKDGSLVYKPSCNKTYISSEILDSPYLKHIRAIAAE